MSVLDQRIKSEIQNVFSSLKNPVTLSVFTKESLIITPAAGDCPTCRDNRLLVEEMASLSGLINVVVYDVGKDSDKVKADQYVIDRIPAIVIEADSDYGLRYFGLPAGYEFTTLLQGIKMVSARESGLSDSSKQSLASITEPTHIQVFVTSSCPYCPMTALMAFQAAFENQYIKASVFNAEEYLDLIQKYEIYTVPKTVINENVQFEGTIPEKDFIDQILKSKAGMN